MYRLRKLVLLTIAVGLVWCGGAQASVLARHELPGRYVMGLDLEPGALWVSHGPAGDSDHMTISRLDPLDGDIVLEASFDFNGRGICYGLGSLWVVDAMMDRVHQIDPQTLVEIASFSTPGTEPCGITCDGVALWISDPWRNRIDRVSSNGAVIGGFGIPNAYHTGLEWDDHTGCGLWTPTGDQVITLYGPTGAVLATRTVTLDTGDDPVFDVAMDAGHCFASSGSFALRVSDPSAPQYREFAFSGREVLGMAWEPGALWVSHAPIGDSDHCVVTKLDPANGTVIAESGILNHNGRGICVAQDHLWVVDASFDRVRKLDPATFAEVASFSTPGSEPCGIAFDGAHLWLTDPWAQETYKLTTAGAIVDQFPIPDVRRMGLEWDPRAGVLWMPSGAADVSRYTTAGAIDHSATLPGLPDGVVMVDLAIAPGHWYVSCREKIYDVSDPASAVLAVFPAADAGFASIQAAVDAATNGDIVSLCSGTFSGAGNVGVNVAGKSLRICSAAADAEACVIAGAGGSRIFHYANAGGSLEDVTVTGGGGVHFGGAMYLTGSSPAISRCVFTGNMTTGGGADLALEYGSSPSVTACEFKFCSRASAEGPIWMRFNCAPRFAYCLIYGNTCALGDMVLIDIDSQATLQNCTIAQNSFSGRSSIGVIHVRERGKVYIHDSIITLNNGQAVYADNLTTDLAFVTRSSISHNYYGDWAGPIAGLQGVDGNTDAYPLFCDKGNHVYTLASASPCAPAQTGGHLIGALPVGCDWPIPPASGTDVPTAMVDAGLFPNPFNPSTTISLSLARGSSVDVTVYDIRGRLVSRLASGFHDAGRHEIMWNGTDDRGLHLASGEYFCRIVTDDATQVLRMMLLK